LTSSSDSASWKAPVSRAAARTKRAALQPGFVPGPRSVRPGPCSRASSLLRPRVRQPRPARTAFRILGSGTTLPASSCGTATGRLAVPKTVPQIPLRELRTKMKSGTTCDTGNSTLQAPAGFELGHARVSTTKQSLERQLESPGARHPGRTDLPRQEDRRDHRTRGPAGDVRLRPGRRHDHRLHPGQTRASTSARSSTSSTTSPNGA
jgi:hypothetical protein